MYIRGFYNKPLPLQLEIGAPTLGSFVKASTIAHMT